MKPLLGTGRNDAKSSNLKAVPSYSYYHVYQLDPKTTENDLAGYLKTMFSEATCEKLESRFPGRYASFKVGVYYGNVSKFLEPTMWPEGAKINKYLARFENFTTPRRSPMMRDDLTQQNTT